MSFDDCVEASRRTLFDERSAPSFMGSANRDGEMQSRAHVGFADEKRYEVRAGHIFAPVEPALGVRVDATIDIPYAITEAWAGPLGGYAQTDISLELSVMHHPSGEVICTDNHVLDSRNTPGFLTTWSADNRERARLSCFGEFGTEEGAILCSVVLRTHALAVGVAGATAEATVDIGTITLNRCCVSPLNPPEGMIPLYRWYSRSREDNFTTSQPRYAGCRGAVRSPDYTFSQCEGFVFDPRESPPDHIPTVKLFSWWNPRRADNLISSDPRWGEGVASPGPNFYTRYRFEGYAIDPHIEPEERPAEALPLTSWWNPSRGDNFTTTDPRWTRHLDLDDIEWDNHHISNGRRDNNGYDLYRLEGFTLGEA